MRKLALNLNTDVPSHVQYKIYITLDNHTTHYLPKFHHTSHNQYTTPYHTQSAPVVEVLGRQQVRLVERVGQVAAEPERVVGLVLGRHAALRRAQTLACSGFDV